VAASSSAIRPVPSGEPSSMTSTSPSTGAEASISSSASTMRGRFSRSS
jgi:hypothetical protein